MASFRSTCQRCGRCFTPPSPLEELKLRGYRFDDLAHERWIFRSPRHADVMLCQGPAMRSTADALRRAYDAMPAPKLVFAIGSCACGGGLWFDSYSVLGPVEKVVPVSYYLPGWVNCRFPWVPVCARLSKT